MIRNKKSGFTLIELMIVVAIIAIIASIAIPKLLSARLSANEAAAVSTLRSISSAQAQVQSSSAIDGDGDGAGEYGYFAELAGTTNIRIFTPGAGQSVGAAVTDRLNPSMLSTAFGNVDINGRVTRSGYFFQMYLPGPTAAGVVPGIGELASAALIGGADPANLPDPNNCEVLWACYAWPVDHGGTGNRAFFVNQEGDLLQCQNRVAAPFDGTANVPAFDECFDTAGPLGDLGMASPLCTGNAGQSGQIWTAVQ
jgi:prepilin-type N-terminal cleavage/methylation domain-containing protein